jgi:hypothetical protein
MTAAVPSPAAASAAVMARVLIWWRIMIVISLDLFGGPGRPGALALVRRW